MCQATRLRVIAGYRQLINMSRRTLYISRRDVFEYS